MRKDTEKAGPSGMSRNEAFSLPQNWGGRDCLLPVNRDVVHELKEAMGGDQILEFVSREFSERAEVAYNSLEVMNLTIENVWYIFGELYPLLFPQ